MKHERTEEDYGSGGGQTSYGSDLFDVSLWIHSGRKRTVLRYKLMDWHDGIQFDGIVSLDSDEKCMEQATLEEIKEMIRCQKERAFMRGEESKAKQIRDCLSIRDYR